MKKINQFITEYIIKKKLDEPIDSEDHYHYDYYPETKKELIKNIKELVKKGITDFNCINTSNITDMSELFKIGIFTKMSFDVSNWDVSNVENMERMFLTCKDFNCDISNWDVSNVINMKYMFQNCMHFEGEGLENWDVSNVTNMGYMFTNCFKFNCDISGWNVSNVENMEKMFFACEKFDYDLSKWNIKNVTNMDDIFLYCDKLKNKPSWYKE